MTLQTKYKNGTETQELEEGVTFAQQFLLYSVDNI